MIVIDGESFDIPILSLDETCDFLDKYAERTVDGKLKRELIGVYFNQRIRFGSPIDSVEMARLWEKLTEPVEFHTVTVPDEDGVDFTFSAYFSNVRRSLRRYSSAKTFWKSMTVNFIAEAPARTPA